MEGSASLAVIRLSSEPDPLIHDPERLRVVATLGALPGGDALFVARLQDMIRLPPGSLITCLRHQHQHLVRALSPREAGKTREQAQVPRPADLVWSEHRSIAAAASGGTCARYPITFRPPAVTAALTGFALAATLLILAPGPDSMLVLRNTLRGGRRAGWVTAGGTLSGLLVWATAAAFGLSAILQASTIGYDALRLAGAGYLVWLGAASLGLFRTHDTKRRPDQAGQPFRTEADRASWGRMYLNGLVSNLFNPKIGIFFIAFLPSFLPARSSATALSFGLGLWFAAETGIWLAALAWLASRGVQWLRRSAVQRWLERLTGIVLIGFGVRLALESR
jgi:threonine/homoserine/homoserine lactone efflux protein